MGDPRQLLQREGSPRGQQRPQLIPRQAETPGKVIAIATQLRSDAPHPVRNKHIQLFHTEHNMVRLDP